MQTYTLVLNAGSSSLKFCVYQRSADAAWNVGTRGQIEGIGTSPRLTVKDAQGQKLDDKKLDSNIRDGRAAIDELTRWLQSHYQGGRIAGVGHRVVHGGPKFSRPLVLSREILTDLKS